MLLNVNITLSVGWECCNNLQENKNSIFRQHNIDYRKLKKGFLTLHKKWCYPMGKRQQIRRKTSGNMCCLTFYGGFVDVFSLDNTIFMCSVNILVVKSSQRVFLSFCLLLYSITIVIIDGKCIHAWRSNGKNVAVCYSLKTARYPSTSKRNEIAKKTLAAVEKKVMFYLYVCVVL